MTKKTLFPKIKATFLFAFGCLALAPAVTVAQTVEAESVVTAPAPGDSLNTVQNFITDTAALVLNAGSGSMLYPDFPDEVYLSRILAMGTPIEVTYNEQVESYVRMYAFRKREQVERMLGLSQIYFPIFEEVLRANNMPTDLKYLAVVESALNPKAVSHCGATGLWQFMYGTAKMYDLKVNKDIDERRDIFKSTVAASQYLRRSYDKYGNWLLAIASYNCGPGNVDKAIARSGGSHDFWVIAKYLPAETRGYVPAFIAAMYVMNHYAEHGLYPTYPDNRFCEITAVPVTEKVCFEKIAQYTNCSVDDIKFLNPGLNSSVVPVWNDPYELKLPAEMLPIWDAMKDSIVLSSRYAVPTYYTKSSYYAGGSSAGSRTHTVRRGETLGSIASKYRMSVTTLKKMNGLSSNTIRSGQKLKVRGSATAVASNSSKSSGGTASASTSAASTSASGKVVYYKVKSGDTLWAIAKRYNGVTVAEIRAQNGAAKTNNLKPGTTLKIVM
ncbi:MAG TPA: LysM peptidoglycan-binding domain-containing protein [Chitinophagales bacterium]|nr:LysM peptidoglycan-binding domain-containing protein [Chitinophagales bacterium]